jgi:hypothetical protein
MRYALIKGNTVFTVVEQDTVPQPNGLFEVAVPAGDAGPGWGWDGVQFTAPPPRNLGTKLSKLAFRNRFTLEEREDMELAAVNPASGTAAARRKAARQRVIRDDILAADRIDLASPRITGAVQKLVEDGIITQARATEILTTPVTESELEG